MTLLEGVDPFFVVAAGVPFGVGIGVGCFDFPVPFPLMDCPEDCPTDCPEDCPTGCPADCPAVFDADAIGFSIGTLSSMIFAFISGLNDSEEGGALNESGLGESRTNIFIP